MIFKNIISNLWEYLLKHDILDQKAVINGCFLWEPLKTYNLK